MQFIPDNAYEYLYMMSGMGMPVPSGVQERAAYEEWVSRYNLAAPTPTAMGSQTNFYFVLAFPQGDFADRIDVHDKYPMFVPATGTSPPILGVFADEKQARIEMEKDDTNVHMMYKCRIPGASGIQYFLELMAENDMLEPVAGN